MNRFPWHASVWNVMQKRIDRLPQAMLIVADHGTGKMGFATCLAGLLLCESKEGTRPCCECKACRMMVEGRHPDLHVVTNEAVSAAAFPFLSDHIYRYAPGNLQKKSNPSKLGNIIGVEQIREVSKALQMTAVRGWNRVCMIYPAEALNINAANALLKILEEPGSGIHFLLPTSALHGLPPTIRSRCSVLKLPNPTPEEAISWLAGIEGVDRDLAHTLLTYGFGALEIQQIFEDGEPGKLAAFPSQVAEFAGHRDSANLIVSNLLDIGPRLGLRLIQQQLFKSYRMLVESGPTDEPLVNVLQANLGKDDLNKLFTKIGRYLQWPVGAVDERLFLEDIAHSLCRPGAGGN